MNKPPWEVLEIIAEDMPQSGILDCESTYWAMVGMVRHKVYLFHTINAKDTVMKADPRDRARHVPINPGDWTDLRARGFHIHPWEIGGKQVFDIPDDLYWGHHFPKEVKTNTAKTHGEQLVKQMINEGLIKIPMLGELLETHVVKLVTNKDDQINGHDLLLEYNKTVQVKVDYEACTWRYGFKNTLFIQTHERNPKGEY